MNKRNFNVVGNNETDNQELAKGIAFVKSRRAELNVVQMVENMRDQALPNGVIGTDEMLLACKYIITPVVVLYRIGILIQNF